MIRLKLSFQTELETLEREAHLFVVKGFLNKINEKFPSFKNVTYYQTSWSNLNLYKINNLDLTDLDDSTEGDKIKSAAVELDLKVEELSLIISLLEREDFLSHVQKAEAYRSTNEGREIYFNLEEIDF